MRCVRGVRHVTPRRVLAQSNSDSSSSKPQPKRSKFQQQSASSSRQQKDAQTRTQQSEEQNDSTGSSRFTRSVLPADYGEQYSDGRPSPFESSGVRTPFADDQPESTPSPRAGASVDELPRTDTSSGANDPGLGLRIELPSFPSAGQLVIVASFTLIILSMLGTFYLTVKSGAISLNAE